MEILGKYTGQHLKIKTGGVLFVVKKLQEITICSNNLS
jgi:hypothetical protein